jgi:ribosomal protein S18 acetylase RimI-like enzyme
VWATDLDVLPVDAIVERRDGYWAVRSPSNPSHYWGTLLLFDAPPDYGDGERWEQAWQMEFGQVAEARHRTFTWDGGDGALGQAEAEFVAHGYELKALAGLVATPDRIVSHPHENSEVTVRVVDPRPGADEDLWAQVLTLELAVRDERFNEASYRSFIEGKIADRRRLLDGGNGAWYVACTPEHGAVVASCGVVVSGGRARYQSVVTAPSHQRRGIASRLVVEAARDVATRHAPRNFVIVADAASRALRLYESLGFERVESVAGLSRRPD